MSRGEGGGGGQIFKKKERKERTSEVTVRPEIINVFIYKSKINFKIENQVFPQFSI